MKLNDFAYPLVITGVCNELRSGTCRCCDGFLDHRKGWCVRLADVDRSRWICDPCKQALEARDAERVVPDQSVVLSVEEQDALDQEIFMLQTE
jgi:hypothetical protein